MAKLAAKPKPVKQFTPPVRKATPLKAIGVTTVGKPMGVAGSATHSSSSVPLRQASASAVKRSPAPLGSGYAGINYQTNMGTTLAGPLAKPPALQPRPAAMGAKPVKATAPVAKRSIAGKSKPAKVPQFRSSPPSGRKSGVSKSRKRS